jgi:hypothetical protein
MQRFGPPRGNPGWANFNAGSGGDGADMPYASLHCERLSCGRFHGEFSCFKIATDVISIY